MWLNAEGASLIGTLRKAWCDDAPRNLAMLYVIIVQRQLQTEAPAADDSCALAVAHLLPALLKCASHSHCSGSAFVSQPQKLRHKIGTAPIKGLPSSQVRM